MSLYRSPDDNFVSTTLNGAINDSATTITLNDASKLNAPGYIVIDREDSSGTATADKREIVSYTGISSNQLTGCTRGADNSTARSHNDGALVEPTFTVGMWENLQTNIMTSNATVATILTTPKVMATNATVTTLLQGPRAIFTSLASVTALEIQTYISASGASIYGNIVNLAEAQTLTNKTLTSPVINTGISGTAIAAGSDVTTGTSNTLVCTAKSIGDAGVNTRLSSKIITATRDLAGASASVSYTGVGFQPTSIAFVWAVSGADDATGEGFVDSSRGAIARYKEDATVYKIWTNAIVAYTAASTGQYASVASFDADGFTLAWTKEGSPTGTLSVSAICYK